MKWSGFDRFAGPEGLRACCLQKSVVEDKVWFVRTSIPAVLQYPTAGSAHAFAMNMVVSPPSFFSLSFLFWMRACC